MYIKQLPNDAVRIGNAIEYIDPRGNVYGIENRHGNPHKGEYFIKAQNTVYGYKYVTITYPDRRITKRVHRLVAEAFIPNPQNLPVVMHLNNKKDDNRVENLAWGTISENTKQAFRDGLSHNAKGVDDNQSIPCDCYDTLTNKLIKKYGSVSEAERDTGITKSGILFHMRNPEALPRKTVYFTGKDEGPIQHPIVVMCDFKTDAELKRFVNIGSASKSTGIADSTISAQVNKGVTPEWTSEKVYFKYIIV